MIATQFRAQKGQEEHEKSDNVYQCVFDRLPKVHTRQIARYANYCKSILIKNKCEKSHRKKVNKSNAINRTFSS